MLQGQREAGDKEQAGHDGGQARAPVLSLPKGGGAIRGIGEKFAANPVTGTGSMTIPIATSPGRSGFGPQLSLSYDSGAGNGPFGLGWNLSLPSITRKTDKGLPKYRDSEESDVFILSGAEDLVPTLVQDEAGKWAPEEVPDLYYDSYEIKRYRPRIEGLFARIERWSSQKDPEDVFWRSISRDNITTWYGKTTESRIADPADPSRIFSWLICESHDDKGNVIVYGYEAENSDNVDLAQANEKNRIRSANRYLKRIRYGSHTPYFPELLATDSLPAPAGATALDGSTDWFFEVVFDYGEHEADVPKPDVADSAQWDRRNDPFSSYRAGFEVRTYRLCQRVLMFHLFPDEPDLQKDCLVRSTNFTYSYEQEPADPRNPIHSVLTSVTQSGHKRQGDGYLTKSLPPLAFKYSQATIHEHAHEIDPESLENLPYGLDNASYQWVDLDGEGLSGILSEQADSWFYKSNWSPINTREEDGKKRIEARFGHLERVAKKPSLAAISSGRQQFLDLAGDGQLDLVELDEPTPGFYERTDDESWVNFKPFVSHPNLEWANPNLKFVDLTGDGHADILISEDDVFCWLPSLAEAGFGPPETVSKALDEEEGPRLVFADSTQSVYLSDMSGDGLTDIARIRNGEVCYWPNLGYGRFGAKVTMDNAPWFDTPELFDQRRIRLADIDGSGVTDILYLSGEGVKIFLNQSGNAWAAERMLRQFPKVDDLSSVVALDLLGNGTACLVWSSSLPGDARRPMQYIDLMGGQKPHLLVKSVNNLGAETHVHYAPSTKFYLQDKRDGKEWITKIPFPVHVVERVETFDRISGNRFITRTAYHHGYFDGIEREFRGFGMVEQWDTEEFAILSSTGELSEAATEATNIDAASHVPPVLTRTWFHTGAFLRQGKISLQYLHEYYGAPNKGEPGYETALIEFQKTLLDDTILPDDLPAEEAREASRALKGSVLRQEIYGLDGSDKSMHPYSISELNYTVAQLQPEDANRHAVFFTHPREAIEYHYERSPDHPRIGHQLTLGVDEFGNVLKSAAIGYGRSEAHPDLEKQKDKAKQTTTLITCTENEYTNNIDLDDAYRTPLPCQARTYELTETSLNKTKTLLGFDDVLIAVADAIPLDYEASPDGSLQKRLIEQVRTLYRDNELSGPLSFKELDSLALSYDSYKLAFTPGLLEEVFVNTGKMTADQLPTILGAEARYILGDPLKALGLFPAEDPDAQWWIPAGQVFYSPDPGHTAEQEKTFAEENFFLPHRFDDPFGNSSIIGYDDPYRLLMTSSRDPLGNEVKAENDYRVLQPRIVTDPNRNRSEATFDALGMVVGTAVMGKETEDFGDTLEGFEADLDQTTMRQHLQDPLGLDDPAIDAQDILRKATTRLIYDIDRFYDEGDPNVVYTLARETHNADLAADQNTRIQHSFLYSDGFGRAIQTKIQAEKGPVPKRDPGGKIIVNNGQPEMTDDDVEPRWVGSGWTVFNNKGKPVKQYEPFFSDTHGFDNEVRMGVSPTLFYDPAERVIATLHPNHTFEKVVFDPWRQETWDVNDTVLETDPKNDPDVGAYFKRAPDDEYLPTWYGLRTDDAEAIEIWPDIDPKTGNPIPDNTNIRKWEKQAAEKAKAHANTSTVTHLDTLGRPFLTIADNADEGKYETRVQLDIEGNERAVIDAKDRLVMTYDYDMLGSRIQQHSMDAGARWRLNDVSGNPIRAWDNRGHTFRNEYDELQRPTASFVKGADATDLDREILFQRTVYGEAHPDSSAAAGGKLNLRGQAYLQLDSAGVVSNAALNPSTGEEEGYDFKGNPLRSTRQLYGDYKALVDWSAIEPLLDVEPLAEFDVTAIRTALTPFLESEQFSTSTRVDALNRAIQVIAPHSSQPGTQLNVIQPSYNEANLLERVDAWLGESTEPATLLPPSTADLKAVENIDYDAKGQRTQIEYGNGAITTYEYDPLTFRLQHLLTRRNNTAFPGDCPEPPPAGWPGCQVQNLRYTYDPAGNITRIHDNAQQTIYFSNQRVEPSADYTYDAIYRLIEVTGREHLGQLGGTANPPMPHSYNDASRVGIDWSANDGKAMGNYRERYQYDEVGNFSKMVHEGTDPGHPGWTRAYTYNEASPLLPAEMNNRLTSTTVGTTTEIYSTAGDGYDPHGNMLRMPQLQAMRWDFQDQLRMTQRQKVNAEDEEGSEHQGERTHYVYDASGQRVRKVTELASGSPKDERIYLGGFEIYRKHTGPNAGLVRETLHIMDDRQRIVVVETRNEVDDGSKKQLIRYQFGNHLGSASLELDDAAQIISYEEYTPYGSTTYQAVRSQTETAKRYRYTGKERDEESGLYYHGKRYYAPWLGRWMSPDPAGLVDGPGLYNYVRGSPVVMHDPNGMQGVIQLEEDVIVGYDPGSSQTSASAGLSSRLIQRGSGNLSQGPTETPATGEEILPQGRRTRTPEPLPEEEKAKASLLSRDARSTQAEPARGVTVEPLDEDQSGGEGGGGDPSGGQMSPMGNASEILKQMIVGLAMIIGILQAPTGKPPPRIEDPKAEQRREDRKRDQKGRKTRKRTPEGGPDPKGKKGAPAPEGRPDPKGKKGAPRGQEGTAKSGKTSTQGQGTTGARRRLTPRSALGYGLLGVTVVDILVSDMSDEEIALSLLLVAIELAIPATALATIVITSAAQPVASDPPRQGGTKGGYPW